MKHFFSLLFSADSELTLAGPDGTAAVPRLDPLQQEYPDFPRGDMEGSRSIMPEGGVTP